MGEDDDLDDEMNQQQLAASTPNVIKQKSFQSALNDDDSQNTTKNSKISRKRKPSQAKKHSFHSSLDDDFGDVNEQQQTYINNMGQHPFSVRKTIDGDLKIGDSLVKFEKEKISIGNKKKYQSTNGLLELLFTKNPNPLLITPRDIENYREIILESNTHKKYFKPGGELRQDNSSKYLTYIMPYLNPESTGFGLPRYMESSNNQIDYLY